MIGKTEEVILLTLMRLGPASPVMVSESINRHHSVALGAVYTTLVRMVDKGWVSQRRVLEGERTKGGPRSFFSVTEEGVKMVRRSVEITNQFVAEIDPEIG